ncbi:GTP-binding protein [Spirulina major CS-329]|uniref:YcjF family protein n=1 Tax=Spirulina TaxID=1154 RepID=UPI00232C482D|nr:MULTISPECIES: GTP-binding protein [Spirulina]MDB9493517.1 GTP-binding protein [Spirulina subsalsa CS-330]MDB9502002.1 GTP-binding protein [Spirulina major CS-329]
MPLPRLITLIVGIGLILGMVLWLVDSIYRLYFQISFTAPLLANLLLLIVIILLGLLIYAFLYYFNLMARSPQSRRARPMAQPPLEKTAAAGANLQAVRRQVQHIEDEVTKRSLLLRSREIEASLHQGEIKVVIFGTGSAGKTSLINGLIGQMVGDVGAAMGTTTIGRAYRLSLPGVDREIVLIDTPGILEAGIAGTERADQARALATEADLLVFVVDNDLRQSEYEPLCTLAEIGKRSLLALNKTDLYPPNEQAAILAHLTATVHPFIPAADIVAICAAPQPVTLADGNTAHPEPELLPLIKRLAAVLRAEGEDLMADNILLQSQRLGEEARRLLDLQRRRQADKIIDRYQWIGAGVLAVTPLPVVDLLATAAVNTQMVVELGKVYGCELNLERGRELALSLGKTLVSLGVVKGAVQLLSTALQFNVATYLVGKTIQGITAAYLTRIAGKSFIEYFRQDQDWGDGGMAEVVQRQFQLVKKEEFVKGFVKDAIAKVVAPIQDALPTPLEDDTDLEPLQLGAKLDPTPEPARLERWSPPRDDWETPLPRPRDDW